MNIAELLSNWIANSPFGERYFEKQSHTLIEGQELYLVGIKCNITFDGQSQLIEKKKYYQTRVQGLKVTAGVNPQADIYICNQTLSQLEDEFCLEYNVLIDELISKINI